MNYIFLLCLMIMPGILFSDTGTPFSECSADRNRFCKDVLNPKSKIIQCLLEHDSELSDACKKKLKSSIEEMRSGTGSACKEDVAKLCKWVVPGGGRIIKCLFKNEDKLSEACKLELNK